VAEVNLPFLAVDPVKGPLHLQLKVTRARFEALTDGLVKRTMAPVRQCLADAKIRPADVSEVVLVGGMTRMPRVVDEVRAAFGKEPFRGVNPDEAVAVGAAIQGGVLEGSVKSVVLLDVTPLSLGIETLGGVFTKLISRNTTIPSRRSQVFSTADDFQSEVEVKVFQGERAMARDNKLLGSFFLTGIPPLPRGQAQIDVTFDIDANGIVQVRARDRKSGKEQSIRIEPAGGLSELEIQKIVAQAEALKDSDSAARTLAEAKNTAETLLRSAQAALKEHSAKVPVASSNTVKRDIEALRTALAGDDGDAIARASATLKDSTMQCFSAAFASEVAQAQPQPQAAPSATSSTEPPKDSKKI
jgi:molecular chaperone DnaK